VARVETDCGIPVQGSPVNWIVANGRLVSSTGTSDDQGIVEADIELGCDASSPARFTAFLPGDPSTAVFSIGVDPGPPEMLLVTPEDDVPVHDATGASNPMVVMVSVTDRCGNYASGSEVSFDIHTDAANGGCFSDQCPASIPGGAGVKDLTGQSTSAGVATFQLYNDTAESVDIWVSNVSPALGYSGGFRRDTFNNFETGNGGFTSGSTSGAFDQEWAWGSPSAGPSSAHSGTLVWATVLDGDYNLEAAEDARYIRSTFNLPCTGGYPLYLKFWEYHDIAAGAVGYVSVWSTAGETPPAADSVSAYDTDVNGLQGYQGQSGGWRQVTFDLTSWECQMIPLYWNLYLNQATSAGFGWAVDDVLLEYFDSRAQGSFAPGPIWDGGITLLHDGVVGCDTSPAGFGMWGEDQWGNLQVYTELQVTTDATGTTNFTYADPGWVVSQTAGGAMINAGLWGSTDVWFTDTAAETVNVTLPTGSGSDPSGAVTFLNATADEVGACQDQMDNDCDGSPDCFDTDCNTEPVCICNPPRTVMLCDESWGVPWHPGDICGIVGDEMTSYWFDFDNGAKVPPSDLSADLSKGHSDCCSWTVWNGARQVDTGVSTSVWDTVTCSATDGRTYTTNPISYLQPFYTVVCLRTASGTYVKYKGQDDCCGDIIIDWCYSY
jgi:hypothetical protein